MHAHSRTQRSRRAAIGLALAATALLAPLSLSACAEAPHSGHSPGPTAGERATSAADATVTVDRAWAKSSAADMHPGDGMTSVFGELTNHSDSPVSITGVSSPAADSVEVHEVIGGGMRPVSSDLEIPANGTVTLEPGGFHIMLMEMSQPILAGDEVTVTVALSDGTTVDIRALVKDTAGANEHYSPEGAEHAGH